MKKLDGYSYQCGVIDAFNEVVRAGVKRIALSHPVDSREEAMELIPFSQQICQQYGNHFYLEESPLLTDLIPNLVEQRKIQHHLLSTGGGHTAVPCTEKKKTAATGAAGISR